MVVTRKPATFIKVSPRQQFLRTKLSNLYVILGVLTTLVFLASPAVACGGDRSFEFAIYLVLIPITSGLTFFPVPLALTIIIEAFILSKRESMPFLKTILLAIIANISCWMLYAIMIVGLPGIIFSFVSSIQLNTIFPWLSLVPILVIPGMMYKSVAPRRGYFKKVNATLYTFLIYLLFAAMGVLMLFLMGSIDINQDLTVLYCSLAALILIGFIYYFIAKCFIYRFICKSTSPTLTFTVFSMQVATLPVILASYYWIHN